MSSEVAEKRYKRKRKKTVLQNARKYAKKGYYGRGSHMDADTYQYFVRILEAYKEGFDNEEDKLTFVGNVFEQTENRETECACNQLGCRVIELLLPFANDAVLKRFMEAFSNDLRPLSSDRFGSFVLQALVNISCQKSLNFQIEESIRTKYKNFAFKISKFLLNNLEDYMWDKNGNHVIRTCLLGLLQLPKSEDAKNNNNNKEHTTKNVKKENEELDIKQEDDIKKEIPDDFKEIVKDYGERLLTWPQFAELCHSELTSGFLQVLVKALKVADKNVLKRYLEKFLNEIFLSQNEDENLSKEVFPKGFNSTSLIMLLETSLQLVSKKMFKKYYQSMFVGRLFKLAKTRSTNFAVQKLIAKCHEKEMFEAIFDELADHFKEIISAGHPAVVLALAQSCKRLSAKQGSFVQSLMKALNCFEPEENQQHFVICACRLTSYEAKNVLSNENLQKEKLNLQGTLMLQQMLVFNKPIKIVNSILAMEPNDLKNLFSNSMGSHIVDSYVSSTFVGEKSRERLVRRMMGTYQDLASSKYGSRAFEAIWNVASMKWKLSIMEELSRKDASWSNSEFGKIIASKINLMLFKRNKDDWKNNFNKNKSAKDLFKDVLK